MQGPCQGSFGILPSLAPRVVASQGARRGVDVLPAGRWTVTLCARSRYLLHETDLDRTVARARLGDATAIGGLYDIFAERVYRFVLVRVRSPADAEDLLQHVFLKVIESLPRYEERGLPFAAWLFRIARNAVIDHERTRRDHASLDETLERPDGRRGPEQLAEAALERAALRSAIGHLTAEQRDVITYRFFAGLTPRETGLLMDRQEGAIRALQFRAILALRESLGHDVEFATSGFRA